MDFIRLYMRVLTLLGAEAPLAWVLALANLLLAGAMFAEPMLFGRVIDMLVYNGWKSHDVRRYLTAAETGRAVAAGLAV